MSEDSNNTGLVSNIETLSSDLQWAEFNTNTESFDRYYPDYYYDFLAQLNGATQAQIDTGAIIIPLWYTQLKSQGEIIAYSGSEYLLDDYRRIFWNRSMPPNYQDTVDLTYVAEPTVNYPVNYGGLYYPDRLDYFQLGWFADREGAYRNDSVVSGMNPKGATNRYKENQAPTGSNIYYLLKRWRKYDIFTKSGSYNRTDNPRENHQSTASVYL